MPEATSTGDEITAAVYDADGKPMYGCLSEASEEGWKSAVWWARREWEWNKRKYAVQIDWPGVKSQTFEREADRGGA